MYWVAGHDKWCGCAGYKQGRLNCYWQPAFLWLQMYLHLVLDERQLPGPGPAIRHPPECDPAQHRRPGQHRGVRLGVTELKLVDLCYCCTFYNEGAKRHIFPIERLFFIFLSDVGRSDMTQSSSSPKNNNSEEFRINRLNQGYVGSFFDDLFLHCQTTWFTKNQCWCIESC